MKDPHGAPLSPDVHPDISGFWDCISDCNGDSNKEKSRLTEMEICEIIERWHTLTRFARLYSHPNINAAYRESDVAPLRGQQATRSYEWHRTELRHQQITCIKGCMACEGGDGRAPSLQQDDEGEKTFYFAMNCRHPKEERKRFSLNAALSVTPPTAISYARCHKAITKYWIIQEAMRYIRVTYCPLKDKIIALGLILDMMADRSMTLTERLDFSEMYDFIQVFLSRHSVFANEEKWRRWLPNRATRRMTLFAPIHSAGCSSYSNLLQALVSPEDVLEAITVSANGTIRPSTKYEDDMDKREFLRTRSFHLSPKEIKNLDSHGQMWDDFTQIMTWQDMVWQPVVKSLNRHLSLPMECIEELWGNYLQTEWPSEMRGRWMLVDGFGEDATAYLIQNSMLCDRERSQPVTREEFERHMDRVDTEIQIYYRAATEGRIDYHPRMRFSQKVLEGSRPWKVDE
ncbi:MAG: hypothetical protein M1831_000341 [Alyxoria varia]|nr:MAG: hypothetical protein M1831_000341 [Alyxoria varia]